MEFMQESKIRKNFGHIYRTKKAFKILGVIFCVYLAISFLLYIPIATASLPRVGPVLNYDGDNPFIVFDERALISAHRAGGALAPENTLSAFKNCLENGEYKVDILEFDLRLTKDGELVLLHDETLDRTSNAVEFFGQEKVKASEKTLAELKQLNMGENFAAEDGSMPYRGLRGDGIPNEVKIPNLNEILDYCESQRSDLRYIIEIKDGSSLGKRATDRLYEILSQRGLTDRAIVGSFKSDILQYIDEKYPTVIRSASPAEVLLTYYRFLFNVNLKNYDLKFKVLQIPNVEFFKTGGAAFVDYCHYYNLAVQYWTINDAEEMRSLINARADGILTDNPSMASKVLERQKAD